MFIDTMGYQRRELFFRILDNRQDIHPITMRFHFLSEHFPQHKLDHALQWLVANDVIGVKFIKWFKQECRGSDLQMHERLLRIVDNEPVPAIIAGKNFRA